MKYWLILVIACALGAGAWLYQSDQRLVTHLPGQATSAPATQSQITADPAAQRHISKLTGDAGDTLDISQADHFVRADQLLKFPPAQQNTQAQSQEVDAGYAVDLGGIGSEPAQASPEYSQQLPLPEAGLVRLSELLDQPDSIEPNIYFLHAVDPDDQQGLWGIVQSALTQTFAKGIALSEAITLQAQIPQDADERKANQTSSFLGSLLNEKVQQTYIYNYRQGILGRDPNLIQPGQQLVIVSFTEAELRQVYQHFTQESHGESQE